MIGVPAIWLRIGGVLGFIAALGAALTALGWIWRRAIWPTLDGVVTMKKRTLPALEKMTALLPEIEKLTVLTPMIEQVVLQLSPNGSSSMLDRVHRIDQGMGALLDKMQESDARHAAIGVVVDHLAGHAKQFTAFEKYQRSRNHWLGNALQRMIASMHRAGIELVPDDQVPPMPPPDPPFPGDDSGMVPDEFPLNPHTRGEGEAT